MAVGHACHALLTVVLDCHVNGRRAIRREVQPSEQAWRWILRREDSEEQLRVESPLLSLGLVLTFGEA